MKKTLSVLLKALQIVLVLALLIYVLLPLFRNAGAFKNTLLTLKPVPFFFGVIILCLVILCYPFIWRNILKSLGFEIDSRTSLTSWIYSNIGKYIPGKIWQFVGRSALTKEVRPEITLFTVFLEVAISFSAAIMVFFLRFLIVKNLPVLWLLYATTLFLLLIGIQHPKIIQFCLRLLYKIRKQDENFANYSLSLKNNMILFGVYFVLWILTGFSFWVMVQGSEIKVSLVDAVTTYPISWILGYLFLIAPAGLGVRESILMTLLKGYYPDHVASAFSIITRIALVISDFFLFFVVWLFNNFLCKRER